MTNNLLSSGTGIQYVRHMGHELSEQNKNITILQKLEKNITEIYEMLQQMCEHSTFSRTVFG